MDELIKQYGLHVFLGIVTLFVSIASWVIKEYYSNQKKTDERQSKSLNGLGERLSKTLDRVESDMTAFRLEMKGDIKEVAKKVDEAIDVLHDIEKRMLVQGYEEELKRIKNISKIDK
jgi:hypothetical protein